MGLRRRAGPREISDLIRRKSTAGLFFVPTVRNQVLLVFGSMNSLPLQVLILTVAGWVNRQQQGPRARRPRAL